MCRCVCGDFFVKQRSRQRKQKTHLGDKGQHRVAQAPRGGVMRSAEVVQTKSTLPKAAVPAPVQHYAEHCQRDEQRGLPALSVRILTQQSKANEKGGKRNTNTLLPSWAATLTSADRLRNTDHLMKSVGVSVSMEREGEGRGTNPDLGIGQRSQKRRWPRKKGKEPTAIP